LTTATAERGEVEAALGGDVRRIVPVNHPTVASRQAYASISLSG
jgi:hypothetical protein